MMTSMICRFSCGISRIPQNPRPTRRTQRPPVQSTISRAWRGTAPSNTFSVLRAQRALWSSGIFATKNRSSHSVIQRLRAASPSSGIPQTCVLLSSPLLFSSLLLSCHLDQQTNNQQTTLLTTSEDDGSAIARLWSLQNTQYPLKVLSNSFHSHALST